MAGWGGKEILRQYGGSYSQLDKLIRIAYSELINLGLTLSFYFDGENSAMKEGTRRERDAKRYESWLAIHDSASQNLNEDQSMLDLPPLSMEQFVYTLTSVGAKQITSKFEADQMIAIATRDGWSHYCNGNDT